MNKPYIWRETESCKEYDFTIKKKRKYTKRKKSEYDACRSFFIYADGRIFIQKVNYETSFCKPGQPVVINMRGALICGKFVQNKGTGFVLSNWTIYGKEGMAE